MLLQSGRSFAKIHLSRRNAWPPLVFWILSPIGTLKALCTWTLCYFGLWISKDCAMKGSEAFHRLWTCVCIGLSVAAAVSGGWVYPDLSRRLGLLNLKLNLSWGHGKGVSSVTVGWETDKCVMDLPARLWQPRATFPRTFILGEWPGFPLSVCGIWNLRAVTGIPYSTPLQKRLP